MNYNTSDWPALPPLSTLVNKVDFEGEKEYNCSIKKLLPRAVNAGSMSNQKGLGAMNNYITMSCPVCGKNYLADPQRLKHGRQTTCSRECSYKYRSMKLSTSIVVSCDHCGKQLVREPAQVRSRVFCSHQCFIASRNDLERDCPVCGKHFRAKTKKHKHCCRKCFEIAHKETMSGVNNPSYIDGRSLNHTYDAGTKWHEIRLAAYERDNFTCQRCGVKCISKSSAKPGNSHLIIQCHHIDPYKKSKNNDLSNLVTLCIRCHRKTHNEIRRSKRVIAT